MSRPSLHLLNCIFLLLLVSIPVLGQVAIDHTDVQNWNDVSLTVPVYGPVDFVVQGTLRNGRNLTRPVDERVGVGFSIKAGKYLTFTPSYIHIYMQPTKIRHVYEERLSLASTVRFPLGGFVISDRNTYERRYRTLAATSTRYRNRLQVEHPIGPAKHKLSLYVSDEVFYDWSFNAWVRNRFAVGTSKVVNKHLTLDLYYMRQNDGRSIPGDLHIIGTNWRFKL
ncbi:MAG TPA: DUF2490 domain-containing protein [Pyrinomonadaceae bacterium]